MTIKEFIEALEELKNKYGEDIEVCKLKRHEYLSTIFKDQIRFNEKEKKIEI